MKLASTQIQAIRLDKEALSLSISADIDFDRFVDFAEPLAAILDCTVGERQWGADRHQWALAFEGSLLWLNYEFYGNICWLSTENEADFEVLEYFVTVLKPHLRVN
ncbi:DUF3630 family protein [Shewanella glacialipiscicola]|uniref:DUF3630 family protein n=1 Tax=Shewanella glacialipiscicola TaxID=614069 RepID=UPI003D7A9342